MKKFLIGGSPCTHWSIAQSKNRETSAEVIIHLLSYALKDIPKDEEIIVLSMYDGIGTGRYCFDKLGYHNIKYYAYEIDKYAMQIANSNYADIIQCGDAVQVREEGWEVEQ